MEIPSANSKEVSDLDEGAWLKRAPEISPFDSLRDEPDIYCPTDGKPFNAEIESAC
jgi:hypothetical protein